MRSARHRSALGADPYDTGACRDTRPNGLRRIGTGSALPPRAATPDEKSTLSTVHYSPSRSRLSPAPPEEATPLRYSIGRIAPGLNPFDPEPPPPSDPPKTRQKARWGVFRSGTTVFPVKAEKPVLEASGGFWGHAWIAVVPRHPFPPGERREDDSPKPCRGRP